MDKLLFSEGGQPLHIEDMALLQSSSQDALRSLIQGWGDCILGGCELQHDKASSAFSWTAGFIAYRGELYRASAGRLDQVDQSNTFYWVFDRNQNAPKTFEDGQERNTQEHYTARLVSMRHAPESSIYIEHNALPRLGVDFARSPRLSYTYEGVGLVAEFVELSRYAGLLTLAFEAGDSLPTTGYFGLFRLLPDINNMHGRVERGSAPGVSATTIELINGKITCSVVRTDGASTSHLRLAQKTYITMPISWDYEPSNGDGAGISQGQGGAGGSTGSSAGGNTSTGYQGRSRR